MAKKLVKKQDGGRVGDTTRAPKSAPSIKFVQQPTKPTKPSLTDKVKTKVKNVVTKVKQKTEDRNKPNLNNAVPFPAYKKGGSIKKKK